MSETETVAKCAHDLLLHASGRTALYARMPSSWDEFREFDFALQSAEVVAREFNVEDDDWLPKGVGFYVFRGIYAERPADVIEADDDEPWPDADGLDWHNDWAFQYDGKWESATAEHLHEWGLVAAPAPKPTEAQMFERIGRAYVALEAVRCMKTDDRSLPDRLRDDLIVAVSSLQAYERDNGGADV